MIVVYLMIGALAALALRRLYYWHALKVLHLKYVDVRAFGAVGDGKTDDTAAFQAANAVAEADGKILYIPPGDYRVRGKVRRHR